MGLSSVASCTQCEAYANVLASHLAAVARTKIRVSASVCFFFWPNVSASHGGSGKDEDEHARVRLYVCVQLGRESHHM
jgi:hypothetical protein